MPTPTKYLTSEEVGAILRVGPWAVVKMCRDGSLAATKPGKSWLITQDDLDAYLAASSNTRTEEDGAA